MLTHYFYNYIFIFNYFLYLYYIYLDRYLFRGEKMEERKKKRNQLKRFLKKKCVSTIDFRKEKDYITKRKH